jgi:hypothetical protein
VTSILILLAVGLLAWRYRQVLGLDQRWDRHGRAHAEDLAAKLGWTNRQSGNGAPTSQPAPKVQDAPSYRSLVPRVDISRLSNSVAVGAAVAVVVFALDLQGYSLLAFLIGIVIGPYFGGAYLRSRWWLLVAPVVAIVAGAGGELGLPVVALPVAVIAYLGIRSDVAGRVARWNAETKES